MFIQESEPGFFHTWLLWVGIWTFTEGLHILQSSALPLETSGMMDGKIWRHNEDPFRATRPPHLLYRTQGKFPAKLSLCNWQNLTSNIPAPLAKCLVCVRTHSHAWERRAKWHSFVLQVGSERIFSETQTKWYLLYNSVNFITYYIQSTYYVRSMRSRVRPCKGRGYNKTNVTRFNKKTAIAQRR